LRGTGRVFSVSSRLGVCVDISTRYTGANVLKCLLDFVGVICGGHTVQRIHDTCASVGVRCRWQHSGGTEPVVTHGGTIVHSLGVSVVSGQRGAGRVDLVYLGLEIVVILKWCGLGAISRDLHKSVVVDLL